MKIYKIKNEFDQKSQPNPDKHVFILYSTCTLKNIHIFIPVNPSLNTFTLVFTIICFYPCINL